MRNIVLLIQKFHAFLIFLVLEAFALFLMFRNSDFHRASYINTSSELAGAVYNKRAMLSEYLRLGEINDELALENALLRSHLDQSVMVVDSSKIEKIDSLRNQRYTFRSAKVINSSVNRENNYITLDRGWQTGVQRGMGVIANNSIVGFVKDVSKNFALVVPVLNKNEFVASVKMKNTGHFGQLIWEGRKAQFAEVKEIPRNVPVSIGDTVLTTGYSSHFPADVMVGVVYQNNDRPNDEFHRIGVMLSTDFSKLKYVEVVSDIMKLEKDSLENELDQ